MNVYMYIVLGVEFILLLMVMIFLFLFRKKYNKFISTNRDEHIILRKNQTFLNRGLRDLKNEAQSQLSEINKFKGLLQKVSPLIKDEQVKKLMMEIENIKKSNERYQEIIKGVANDIDFINNVNKKKINS